MQIIFFSTVKPIYIIAKQCRTYEMEMYQIYELEEEVS